MLIWQYTFTLNLFYFKFRFCWKGNSKSKPYHFGHWRESWGSFSSWHDWFRGKHFLIGSWVNLTLDLNVLFSPKGTMILKIRIDYCHWCIDLLLFHCIETNFNLWLGCIFTQLISLEPWRGQPIEFPTSIVSERKNGIHNTFIFNVWFPFHCHKSNYWINWWQLA